MRIKTIFLDRDGVINKEKNYLYKIKDFEFIKGTFSACQDFIKLGYKIIVISNQSGISRGYYTETDYQKINNWMISQFNNNNVEILDSFHCPHSPSLACNCRKPRPGMFNIAVAKYNINLTKSWMIGDKEIDITAANLAGIKNTVLVRSGHEINEKKTSALFILDSIKDAKNVIRT
jgi:D-glycero-D-manno-heptose 1,7-bisphosphate phosphatase